MASGRSSDFDYRNQGLFQIHPQISLQCSTARRVSFSVESFIDLKRAANLFRLGRAGWVVVFDQHPCGDAERGGTGNPDRNRGVKNSTTRARRRPSLPLAILALALISGVVRGLVACGLLTLSERDASLSVTDRHIAFAGCNPHGSVDIRYIELGPRT